jgi:hypothetical protein
MTVVHTSGHTEGQRSSTSRRTASWSWGRRSSCRAVDGSSGRRDPRTRIASSDEEVSGVGRDGRCGLACRPGAQRQVDAGAARSHHRCQKRARTCAPFRSTLAPRGCATAVSWRLTSGA